MKQLVVSLLILLLSGCTTLPTAIQKAPTDNLQLRNVSLDVDQYKNRSVRWGGKIIRVVNDAEGSVIEMHHFPVNERGFPLKNRITQGRFIVHTDHVLDPNEYQQGLLLTVAGTIASQKVLLDNGDEYIAPELNATEIHMWPYRKYGDKAETITGTESRYRFYGYGGSGYFNY